MYKTTATRTVRQNNIRSSEVFNSEPIHRLVVYAKAHRSIFLLHKDHRRRLWTWWWLNNTIGQHFYTSSAFSLKSRGSCLGVCMIDFDSPVIILCWVMLVQPKVFVEVATFFGPHELGCSIPDRTLQAECSIFFSKSSTTHPFSSRSFFISGNIWLMDELRVSPCLSETSVPPHSQSVSLVRRWR